ncbi:hypothetical protein QF027_008231 [Streptomyces canus]|nr:hypothetical protein [Streptomyces canus]
MPDYIAIAQTAVTTDRRRRARGSYTSNQGVPQ